MRLVDAAGCRALERKPWDEAVVRLRRALVCHPDDPDVDHHRLRAIRLLPCEEVADLEKALARRARGA